MTKKLALTLVVLMAGVVTMAFIPTSAISDDVLMEGLGQTRGASLARAPAAPGRFAGMGLGSLPLLSSSKTRAICPENPTGEKGGACRTVPPAWHPARDLGQGWKVHPFLQIPAGARTALAEINGPGTIQSIWMAVADRNARDSILRFYWDGETSPSIEVPLGDFFGCGHGGPVKITSLPVATNPSSRFEDIRAPDKFAWGALSYWPMPFRKSAKVTVENQGPAVGCAYQIVYSLGPVPDRAAYLHAQWRRSAGEPAGGEHVILDNVTGRGHYVGTYIAWTQVCDAGWGEGRLNFYIDGDGKCPTICGTGTEHYFGGAGGFRGADDREHSFSTPFLGLPLINRHEADKGVRYGLYRWHVMDPIRFKTDLRVTIEPVAADIASVAYWYQFEPHGPFPALPFADKRRPTWPRADSDQTAKETADGP